MKNIKPLSYNYEDAIVISERIVREDLFTSIHIEEFTLEVRDTKRGLEELTNDIPNVSADATKDLDEHGLVRVGVEVKEGDILIGKITPKENISLKTQSVLGFKIVCSSFIVHFSLTIISITNQWLG